MLAIITHYHCEKGMIKLIVTGRHFWWQEAMMKINWLQYTFRIGNNGTWQEANKGTWPCALINELCSPLSPSSWEQHRDLNEKSIALCNSKLESVVWCDFLFFSFLRGRMSQLKTEFSCKEQLFKKPAEGTWGQSTRIHACYRHGLLPRHLKECGDFTFPFSQSSSF